MPTEQEELRLTVSLVDNASQGIAALRNQMQGLSSGQSAQAFETFRRNQREMGNQIKAITEAAIGGEKALRGYIGKFGILGLAVSTGIGILKEYAEGLEGINRASATLGTAGTNIKSVVDQLKAVGASDKDALREVNSFVDRSNDLLRQNSAARQEFMRHAADPAATQAFLDAMDKAQSLEERMNLAREAAGRVFQNRLDLDRQLGKSTETALQDATAARNAFLEALGMTPEVEARLKGAFRKMSEEQQRTNEDVLKRGEEITQMWNNMGAAATRSAFPWFESYQAASASL